MNSFKEILESPVGSIGRTGIKDAESYVTANPDLKKRIRKIIKEVGGITALKQLISGMNTKEI